jgi:histidine triad (HIT) family protein
MAEECLFCAIVAGSVPSKTVFSDEDVVAFIDVRPQAPTHLLVVPRQHFTDLLDIARDPAAAGAFVAGIRAVAESQRLRDFRTVLNTGVESGQSVFHLHAHLLAGRRMG